MRVLLLTALLAGCPDPKPAEDDTSAQTDSCGECEHDGDGFSGSEGDCNDEDAAINPDAEDICDGIDNNCDGEIDENVQTTFYADADADGFGDPDAPTEACERPSGAVGTGTDCDDADASRYPGAAEVCDTVDNDCDGDVDEGVEATRYIDADGDGHGDPAQPIASCEPLDGTSEDALDCDDTSADVSPDASEHCDSVDEDCDGEIDESAVDLPTWYLDFDGDGYGTDRLTTAACDAPAGYVDNTDDCDDTSADVSPGATEVCDGVDDDCDDAIDEGLTFATWYDDADGDGYGDDDTEVEGCEAPSADAVRTGSDCDDTSADVSPAESETCDGVDEDCSGAIDDGGVCPCDVVDDGSHSYQLCTDEVTWATAYAACAADAPYHLVVIDSATEDTFLRSEVGAYSADYYWWIGYTDAATEGTWAWVDGSSAGFTNWNSGEPNDLFGEDCATFAYSGDWNDWNCNNATSYVCEAP